MLNRALCHAMLRWGWVCLLGGLLTAPCQARVVGLVLDDSGSMRPIFERAQFATQLLVTVLNPEDRLYLVRLNGEQGQLNGPLDLADRPALLAQIRSQWQAINNNPTPYPPLDAALERLVAVTPPGEEASLLVITDGDFNTPPLPAVLTPHYQQLKSAFHGKNLAVHFVVLHHQQDLRTIIDQQGIRQALLTTFNGSPDAGRVDIDKAQNVFPGLRRVITELYGTDPDDRGDVVHVQGNHIRLNPPFSIRRLVVAVADAQGNAPAQLQHASFALRQNPPLQFQPATAHNRAQVYHLQPVQPLLPGGDHNLTFDRPLPPDTQVLFDSGLDLELHFFDQGQPVLPNAQGRLIVAKDTPLEVRATLIDRLNPQAPQVDFSALPQDPVFTLYEGQRSQPMRLDKPHNYASAAVRYAQPGQYTLTVQARYPGFVIRRAQDVIIEVQAIQPITLTLTPERRDGCTDCAADETRAVLTRQPGYRDLFGVTLRADGIPDTGAYRLELADPLPAGVRLLLPDGQALAGTTTQSDALKLAPGQPAQLRLQYAPDYRDTTARAVRLTAKPLRADWRGAATLSLTLRPHIPTLQFKEAGHTGSDPTQPFQLPVTALGQQQGVFVAATNALRDLDPTRLQLTSPTLHFTLHSAGPTTVRVIPEKAWWCDCLTPAGTHSFTLNYADPELKQSARYTGQVTLVDVSWLKKCWQEALVLIVALLILSKIVCHLRTVRFPPRSHLVVMGKDKTGPPRRIHLHAGWSSWLACWDERGRADVLRLRALPNGAAILPHRNLPDTLCFEQTGDALVELFAERRQRELAWRWGEALTDETTGQRYVLVKDIRQFRPDDD